jgi:hypothetical protein
MELLFGIGLLAAAGYVGYRMGIETTIHQQNQNHRRNRRRR